jgi:hypothetical protein
VDISMERVAGESSAIRMVFCVLTA